MSNNTDAPLASVPALGLSEIVTVLTLIGSALTALYGRDWGIAANAQHYAGIAVVLLPIGLSIARAIKHYAATTANAKVATVLPIRLTVDPPAAPSMAEPVADPYPGGDVPVIPAQAPPTP